jgi:hypothetical protein
MKEMYEKKVSTKVIGYLSRENGEYIITVNQKDGNERKFNAVELLENMIGTTIILANEDFETI